MSVEKKSVAFMHMLHGLATGTVLVQNVSTDRAQVATIALGVNAGVNAKIHFEAGMR